MTKRFTTTIALGAVVLIAAAFHTDRPAAPAGPSVVLISLDGFRWDYLDRPAAVNLRALAQRGVRAQRMIPSFPSLTFPNHYTLVTGLYPEHHGIVSNTMRDSVLGGFRISDTTAVRTASWWGGEPIWVTAEKQGEHAAAFFWPGSEAPIGGMHPWRWLKFDDRFPNAARVDSVLAWLSLPAADAPRMVNLYYSDVDHAGHSFGPDAPQIDSAIARVDSMVGRLVAGLAARGLSSSVNVIVVADHGMTAIAPARSIFLDDYIALGDVQVVDQGAVGALIPRAGMLDSIYRRLRGANPHLAVYKKADVPPRFHYNNNSRITPLVLIADEGWTITTRAARPPSGGAHGYDNQLVSMGALFVAAGPAFRAGITVAPFQNVHVYTLLCHLLGLTPAANDGSLDSTRAMLK